jgi:L-ascorbate metabolism protein UlaG (beta-lactamase superfamily)
VTNEPRSSDSTYDLAFETVGNATLVVHDRVPLLATDPWLEGPAYFGSWVLAHEIPEEQLASIHACKYIWVSHGHPDHLSMRSLEGLRDQRILLPDHVGGRIRDSLTNDGFRVSVLPDREWVPLSSRVRVMSIADSNQDGVLLVDMDGILVINANDASDRGWAATVRKAARKSTVAFLLALSGYGDADMINYFDLEGNRIPPRAARRIPPGPAILARMEQLGADYFVPFASLHAYQREDSAWANEYTTGLDDFARGFESDTREILPAFIRYDCTDGSVTRLDPPARPIELQPPAAFGDDWDERLSAADVDRIASYFGAITSLQEVIDMVVFRVGGEDHEIPIVDGPPVNGKSVRFEAPRSSLMSAVEWEIFDDLLIGNFVKTTLLGHWPSPSLRPDFTARVTKYADNGYARTTPEVRQYLAEYRRRAPIEQVRYEVSRRYTRTVRTLGRRVRSKVSTGSTAHRVGQAVYGRTRR